MNKTIQFRVRLSSEAAKPFLAIPPKARARALSLLIASSSIGIDLEELLAFRRELSSLGNLINQSLRTSWGETVDKESIDKIIKILRRALS